MRLMHFYIRNRQVIIPTVARTTEGFYLEIEPVAVIEIKDLDLVRESLKAVLSRENLLIPTPERAQEPGSVILETLGIRRWQVFEKEALFYSVRCSDESITVCRTGRSVDGMWIEEKDKEKVFDLTASIEDIVQFLVEDMLSKPEMSEPLPPSPVLLPPPRNGS